MAETTKGEEGGGGGGGRRSGDEDKSKEALQSDEKLVNPSDGPSGMFDPSPGILLRVQNASVTMRGLPVSRVLLDRILTRAEIAAIKSKRYLDNAAPSSQSSQLSSSSQQHQHHQQQQLQRSMFMEKPFSRLSVINENLGLTGLAGLTVENLHKNFRNPLGCVINATYEVPLFKPAGVEAYRIPVTDDDKEDLSIYFDEVTAKLHEICSAGKVAIVHCMAGVSRSSTFVLAYLMRYHDKSLRGAFEHVKSRRIVSRPNLNFLCQLSQYEVSLRGDSNRSPWQSYTHPNGVTRCVPQFVIDTCLSHYAFEFMPHTTERSKSGRSIVNANRITASIAIPTNSTTTTTPSTENVTNGSLSGGSVSTSAPTTTTESVTNQNDSMPNNSDG